ncbi:hypothetical protein A8B75_13135 [Sphingomonadales bacterium EhC05]|nr:hypothetical protein A8B75_13135 [Sphingomonadales bacterium EhC05]
MTAFLLNFHKEVYLRCRSALIRFQDIGGDRSPLRKTGIYDGVHRFPSQVIYLAGMIDGQFRLWAMINIVKRLKLQDDWNERGDIRKTCLSYIFSPMLNC